MAFKLKHLLYLTLFCLPAIFYLLKPGFFSVYDDMQVIRLWQMHKCFLDLQIPCRWVPDLGLGYGYPLYIFYAPLPYYFMEPLHLMGLSLISTVKAGYAFSIIFSAIFFYKFIRFNFSKYASLVATAFYIYAPFRASSVYVRGAMGEAWGLALIPLPLFAFENYVKKSSRTNGVLLSISLGLILVTHNLTNIIFLPFFAIWVISRLYSNKEIFFKNIIKIFLFSFLGFGLSAFFTVPLFFERNLVHLETLTGGYFGYLQHFLNLKQIFLSTKWGYGPSVAGPNDAAFLGIGPLHTALALLGFLTLLTLKNKKYKHLGVYTFLTFIFSTFLTHEKSTFIWKILNLDIMQFPWRFIAFSVLTSSVLTAFFLDYLKERLKSLNFKTACLLILLTLSLYTPFFKPKDTVYVSDEEKLTGENLVKQSAASIYDYLPKSANRAPDEMSSKEFFPIGGHNVESVDLIDYEKGTDWFKYEINLKGEDLFLAIPAYDYPIWDVKVNGKEVNYKRFGDFGLPQFKIENGLNVISAKLTSSWDRKAGDLVSLLSIFLVIKILLYDKEIKKNHSI